MVGLAEAAAAGGWSLLFLSPSFAPEQRHLRRRPPASISRCNVVCSSNWVAASFCHTVEMLAARSFAAPARQCLRQANRTSRWAPALSQASFPSTAYQWPAASTPGSPMRMLLLRRVC
jgi:hypothetical protein